MYTRALRFCVYTNDVLVYTRILLVYIPIEYVYTHIAICVYTKKRDGGEGKGVGVLGVGCVGCGRVDAT